MEKRVETADARARLEELYPSCATDCTDGCKYGCLGWLHRFEPHSDPKGDPSNSGEERTSLT